MTALIGHEWAITLLKNQQASNRITQALLITGPPNIGKNMVARFLARSLNCLSDDRPCERCVACRKIRHGNHPDVRIFDDSTETLKIEAVRSLQRELALSPVEGRYRVAVLNDFERATTSAANALLKTLEEPPPQVIIILTTAEPQRLLPTIRSRCQQLPLRPLPNTMVESALQSQWQVPPEQAQLLTQLAAGRLGWAVQALEDETLLERRKQCLSDFFTMLHASRVERLAYAQKLSKKEDEVTEVLTFWLTFWRDLLLLQSGCQTAIINIDWEEKLQPLTKRLTITQTHETILKIRAALRNLEYNVNLRLNLEVLLLKLPRLLK